YPLACGPAGLTSVCDIIVGYDSNRPPHYKLSSECNLSNRFTSIIIPVGITSIPNRYYQLILVVR
uniref:Uncharacterized protein n=1 Tax=Amphimedon queenslandica TaxID=400682 RepID=A0A1X7THP9_AMPQE